MKTVLLFCFILCATPSFALHIAQVSVWSVSNSAFRVSVDTEAEELYYFESHHYTATGHTIVLDLYFIKGFGSTISPLNNSFEIAAATSNPAIWQLRVNAYYLQPGNAEKPLLQDFAKLSFSTPLRQTAYLYESPQSILSTLLFPNPTSGELYIPACISNLAIYDANGRKIRAIGGASHSINLGGLPNGIYFVTLNNDSIYAAKRIILRQ